MILNQKIDENRVEYVQTLLSNADIINGMPSEDFNYEFIKIKLRRTKITCWYWRYEK